jgi:predicted GNAT family acetyltransferase
MALSMTSYEDALVTKPLSLTPATGMKVKALSENEQEEALSFLAARPIHTVCMASFLRENGVIHPDNRGMFFGCRDASGALQGVALIGHATLLETRNDEALQAFAYVKHKFASAHLIRGEHDIMARFWAHYSELGHEPRLALRELLFVQTAAEAHRSVERDPDLRPATLDELDQLKIVNAEFIEEECGINPLTRDPEGFTKRLARRIAKNKLWIVVRDGDIVFKADVFAKTPQAAYLEGIFVHSNYRGRGLGRRYLCDLSNRLLDGSDALVLLINENERKRGLEHFYTKAGYSPAGMYDTIYLNPDN